MAKPFINSSLSRLLAILGLVLLTAVVIRQCMPPDRSQVVVTGKGLQTLELHASDLTRMTHTRLEVEPKPGEAAAYDGVPLISLLETIGLPTGDALRGDGLKRYVQVTGADGYQVVFSLPELDPAFRTNQILLADRKNSLPLDASEGPLRLVVPGEKRQARWVKSVVRIDVLGGE